MKVYRVLSALCMAALLLVGCSKDMPEQGGEFRHTNVDPIRYRSVEVSLLAEEDEHNVQLLSLNEEEAESDSGGLRMVQVVKNASVQDMDPNGAATIRWNDGRDPKILLAVRNADNPSQVVYTEVYFAKVDGQNKASFKGQIDVPDIEGDNPRYELAAIVLGTAETVEQTDPVTKKKTRVAKQNTYTSFLDYDKNRGVVRFNKPQSQSVFTLTRYKAGDQLPHMLPYLAKWKELTLSSNGKDTFKPLTLNFKPSGTLLRIKFRNKSPMERTFQKFSLSSNAFVDSWEYNFANWDNNNLVEGYSSESKFPYTIYSMANTMSLSNGYSWGHYYFYVMPRKGSDGSFETTLELMEVQPDGIIRLTNNKALPLGNVNIEANMGPQNAAEAFAKYGGDVPLAFLAKANTPRPYANNNLVISNPSGQGGYFEYSELTGLGNYVLGAGYNVPNPAQWGIAMPAAGHAFDWGSANYTKQRELITMPRQYEPATTEFYADYKAKAGDAIYALRFIKKNDNGTWNNAMRVAYRYKWLGHGHGQGGMQIEAVYVGEDPSVSSVDNIMNDSGWWQTRRDKGEVYTRILPNWGVLYGGNVQQHTNYIWYASSKLDGWSVHGDGNTGWRWYTAYFGSNHILGVNTQTNQSKEHNQATGLQVRLIGISSQGK